VSRRVTSRRSVFRADGPVSEILCLRVLSKVLKFILLRFPRISGLCGSDLGDLLSFETGVGVPPRVARRESRDVFSDTYI